MFYSLYSVQFYPPATQISAQVGNALTILYVGILAKGAIQVVTQLKLSMNPKSKGLKFDICYSDSC